MIRSRPSDPSLVPTPLSSRSHHPQQRKLPPSLVAHRTTPSPDQGYFRSTPTAAAKAGPPLPHPSSPLPCLPNPSAMAHHRDTSSTTRGPSDYHHRGVDLEDSLTKLVREVDWWIDDIAGKIKALEERHRRRMLDSPLSFSSTDSRQSDKSYAGSSGSEDITATNASKYTQPRYRA